jgi:hypothetical protein
VNYRNVLRQASTPITLVVLLGLLAAGAAWGYSMVTAKVEAPPPPECVTMQMRELTPETVTVRVYNAGSIRGLAGDVADKLEAAGFIIGTVGNKEANVAVILIVGAATDSPEVQLVSRWFVDPNIQGDGRVDHTVDIILGNSFDTYVAWAEDPDPVMQIPGGQVCLPETPTPSTTETPTPAPTTTGT